MILSTITATIRNKSHYELHIKYANGNVRYFLFESECAHVCACLGLCVCARCVSSLILSIKMAQIILCDENEHQ